MSEGEPQLPKRRTHESPPADEPGAPPKDRQRSTDLGIGANLFQAVFVMFTVAIGTPILMFVVGPSLLFSLALSLGTGIILSGTIVMIYRGISKWQSRRQQE